jgi:hypothetical protein
VIALHVLAPAPALRWICGTRRGWRAQCRWRSTRLRHRLRSNPLLSCPVEGGCAHIDLSWTTGGRLPENVPPSGIYHFGMLVLIAATAKGMSITFMEMSGGVLRGHKKLVTLPAFPRSSLLSILPHAER